MAEPSRPARLWYQSFVHPIEQAPYIERLQALLDAAAGPSIRFEVHGLDPPDHLFHPRRNFAARRRPSAMLWTRSVRDTTPSSSVTSRSPAFWKSAVRSTSPWLVSAKRHCLQH